MTSRLFSIRSRRSLRNGSAEGFTLMEVILALAILAGALAVLGEVMSLAGRNAQDAQSYAQAQLLAASVMDEMLTGYTPLVQQSRQALESDDDTPWVYSVTLGTTTIDTLQSVEVVVEQDLDPAFNPVTYRLVKWVPMESAATTGADNG
jgi:type II secretion system protein I